MTVTINRRHFVSTRMRSALLAAAALFAGAAAPALAANSAVGTPIPGVKNIIVIINDGGGHTVYDATRKYLGHNLVTDGAAFKKISISTYPLREDAVPNSVYSSEPTVINNVIQNNNFPIGNNQQAAVVYSSAKFWDTTVVAGPSLATGYGNYPAGFAGYEWSRFAHPDSGNTASSLANGNRSYNNSINVDGNGIAQVAITDVIDAAIRVGKRTGVVSTVQFGDATPAALGGAHNLARANRTAIANEMFGSGKLDVIGGTGNPDFDDNGVARTANYSWITSTLWADLKAKTNVSGFNALKWPLLQNKADIEKLANKQVKPPVRVAMIIKGDNSSQYNRAGANLTPTLHDPYVVGTTLPVCSTRSQTPVPTTRCSQPFQANVPSQRDVTIAALNVLGSQGKGFYLMSENGSVDRAEHGNSTGRMIEEVIASDNTVQAVIDWVNRADTAATWDDTLLIVTADHDHLLYGPDAATVPFQDVVDNGAGQVPSNRWFGPNHGTGLVPLFAYGKGADAVAALATENDSFTGSDGITRGYGLYTEQTVIGATLKATAGNAN